MAEILKVFTPEQIYELMKNKVIADNVGLTNFNPGSRVRSILEAVGIAESTTGMDYLEGMRRAIPTALYDGLDFTKKGATKSSGFLRFFRLPEFTIEYTGAGTDCLLTISATDLTTTCAGAAGDNLSLAFSTYLTVGNLITAINSAGNYTATLVASTGSSISSSLHTYAAIDILLATSYLNVSGVRDICLSTDGLITLISGLQAEINNIAFTTLASSTIASGDATSVAIASEALVAGVDGEINAGAIDTLAGQGFLVTPITNVEHAKNDSAFSGGADAETDDERALRFQVYIQGLSGGTTLAMKSAVLAIEGVKSVTIRENYPQRGINEVVADDGTGALSAALITEIEKVLNGDPDDVENYPGVRSAGVTANIEAPIVVPTDVTIEVFRVGELSDATEITTNVQSAIERYVNTRVLGDDVVVNQIRKVAMNAHPSVYDVSITLPVANVSINTSSVARTGSGTGALVTVSLTTHAATP